LEVSTICEGERRPPKKEKEEKTQGGRLKRGEQARGSKTFYRKNPWGRREGSQSVPDLKFQGDEGKVDFQKEITR